MSQQGYYQQQQDPSFLQSGDGGGDSLSKPILGLLELVDRILDKGLVIDAYISISVIGIPLVVIRARIVVASLDTFLRYADAMGLRGEPGERIEQRPSWLRPLSEYQSQNYYQQQQEPPQEQYQQQQQPAPQYGQSQY